jgi:hypothetical protein
MENKSAPIAAERRLQELAATGLAAALRAEAAVRAEREAAGLFRSRFN